MLEYSASLTGKVEPALLEKLSQLCWNIEPALLEKLSQLCWNIEPVLLENIDYLPTAGYTNLLTPLLPYLNTLFTKLFAHFKNLLFDKFNTNFCVIDCRYGSDN